MDRDHGVVCVRDPVLMTLPLANEPRGARHASRRELTPRQDRRSRCGARRKAQNEPGAAATRCTVRTALERGAIRTSPFARTGGISARTHQAENTPVRELPIRPATFHERRQPHRNHTSAHCCASTLPLDRRPRTAKHYTANCCDFRLRLQRIGNRIRASRSLAGRELVEGVLGPLSLVGAREATTYALDHFTAATKAPGATSRALPVFGPECSASPDNCGLFWRPSASLEAWLVRS